MGQVVKARCLETAGGGVPVDFMVSEIIERPVDDVCTSETDIERVPGWVAMWGRGPVVLRFVAPTGKDGRLVAPGGAIGQ